MQIVRDVELSPGSAWWNHLDEIDPARPPHEQESIFGCQDVLTVKCANGVFLDVHFAAPEGRDAWFVVTVVPVPDDPEPEWGPAVERECHEWDELRSAIFELAKVAENWTS